MQHAKLFSLMAGAAASISAPAMAQTTDQQNAHRAEIASDAATRTSLLTNDYRGSEGGLTVYRQGDTAVALSGQFQFRYTANIRDDEPGEESFTHGFSVRRAKLIADADLNETWSVKIQGAFDRDGGSFELEDAYADWDLDDMWTLRFGQFKTPTLREELISSTRSQAADRSETNEVFNLDRTQGLAAIYTADQWDFVGSFNTGANTDNTDFNGANNADYGVTGRAQWLIKGDRTQLRDFAGWQGQEGAAQLGGAVHFQDGGSTGVGSVGSTADVQLLQLTADLQWEGNGWNAFGAVMWDHIDPAMGNDIDTFGLVAQGGVFLSESDELFGRYDVIFPDDEDTGDDPFNTITVGWNHYFIPESHASKFTLDLQWFLNETTNTAGVGENAGIGLLSSGNENQIALRAQYQATF